MTLPGMEEPVAFVSGASCTLRGILHLPPPDSDTRSPAIVLLHGWPGNRLGPHRMFVTAARRFSAQGWPCLRFDFSGRGDSDGETAQASIRSMVDDTRDAMQHVRSRWPDRPILLLGICSGAKVAIGAAAGGGVAGLMLWSAERMGALAGGAAARRSADSLRTYARKLLRPDTWRRLLQGSIQFGMVRRAVLPSEVASRDERRQEDTWLNGVRNTFRGPVLLVFGTGDPDAAPAASAYEAFFHADGREPQVHTVPGANHSYYSLGWESDVLETTHRWLSLHGRPG